MSFQDEGTMGPVEVLVVEFPGNRFTGDVAPAIADLEDAGLVHVLDLVFVSKDADGNVSSFELGAQSADGYAPFDAGAHELLSEADLAGIAEGLDPDSSVGVLIWENVWAARFAKALRDADGRVLANHRIPREQVEAALAALTGG